MNKWLFLTAAFCGLLGCSDQDMSEEDSPDFQAQQASLDAGTSATAPATSVDGSIATTPTTDGGASASVSGELGSACVADGDCKAVGTRCIKQVAIPFGGITIELPGGLCTKNCTADAQCGAGHGCPLSGAAAFLPDIAQCLKVCKSPSDCRQGYNCATPPAFPGFGGAAPAAGPAVTHCLPPTPGLPF